MTLSPEEIEKRIADSYELPNQVLEKVSDPIVSIRTSTYNHAPYIRQCIEGVLMQKTTFSFEFIIGEDFSTDETREIVFEYAKKYPNTIRVVTADYNVGSKANGQRCIRRCRGKYMAICEGDDYWTDPLKLQKQVDFLEKNPKYAMCFHQASICNELNIKPYIDCSKIENREYSANELFFNWLVPTASILYKNDITPIEQFLKPSRILNGDIILILNCALHGKIRGMSETMSVYRMHSMGVTYDKNIQRSRVLKYPDHYKFIKDNFPVVSKINVNIKIAESYYQILKVTLNINWIKYLGLMIYYDPLIVIRKVYIFLKR